MRDGAGDGASGIAINDAREGEDVGVSGLSGLIPLRRADVTVVKVPSIAGRRLPCRGPGDAAGGPSTASWASRASRRWPRCRRRTSSPTRSSGRRSAVVEAAIKGVAGTLVVSEDLAPQAIQRIEAAGIRYRVVDTGSLK